MIELTEEMQRSINNARTNGNPCILATASPEGLPNAGFRGNRGNPLPSRTFRRSSVERNLGACPSPERGWAARENGNRTGGTELAGLGLDGLASIAGRVRRRGGQCV